MDCVTLWIGDSLGPVERACLRSVLGQGHRLVVYCYRPPAGVPVGVEIRDAAAILPQASVIQHARGSVALFSDRFRYELQRRGAGTWIDTDVYLLAPLPSEPEYLFGEQKAGQINNAILRLPANSPALPDLLLPFGGKTPPWLPARAYWPSRLRELITGRADVARMPWGSTGPAALSAVAAAHGLQRHALPPKVFYPVPWEKAGWVLNPGVSLDQVVTEQTVAVHLWNEQIKAFKNAPAPKGSFLDRLHREGAR
jgi:Alpha 1,4-glycosyltransferase conserved region